jgi:hypothetical protein
MDEVPQLPRAAPPERTSNWKTNRLIIAAIATLLGGTALAGIGWVAGVFDGRTEVDAQLRLESLQKPADLLSDLHLFQGWEDPKPDVVLVLSGEMHGYLQPCGCSSPQLGGLTRRYNLVQMLRQRGWAVVAADLGDIPQAQGPQTLLKYGYAMKALDKMGYTAVSFGEYERRLPLHDALGSYSLNHPTPAVVCANLSGREPGELFNGTVFDSALAANHQGSKVGIFGLTGLTVEKKVEDTTVQFNQNTHQVLHKALADLKNQGAQLTVLLYQGSLREAQTLATWWNGQRQNAAGLARIDAILYVSRADLPPSQPILVGDTMLVEVGHKGKYVGAIGAFRRLGASPATPFALKYQLVALEPPFETPLARVKTHPLMELMENYSKDVKNGNYLEKYKKNDHPVQVAFPDATYLGSEKCKKCHESAFKVWEGSPHSHAFKKLEEAKNPSLRQYDAECVRCHSVGFDFKTGFDGLDKTANLMNVGCESCHGPGSKHKSDTSDMKVRELMNPFKYRSQVPESKEAHTRRLNAIGFFCQQCHDDENDLHFDIDKYWPRIVHMTPPEK